MARNKFICTRASFDRTYTAWGNEVKEKLWEHRMNQNDLSRRLIKEGFEISNMNLSQFLRYGYGALTTQKNLVIAINNILGIPMDDDFLDGGYEDGKGKPDTGEAVCDSGKTD